MLKPDKPLIVPFFLLAIAVGCANSPSTVSTQAKGNDDDVPERNRPLIIAYVLDFQSEKDSSARATEEKEQMLRPVQEQYYDQLRREDRPRKPIPPPPCVSG